MNRKWYGVLCLVLLFALTASAQVVATRGSLLVVVTDQSGSVIPGATVILTTPQGEVKETTLGQGDALFLSLQPGLYDVRVEMANFSTAKAKDVQVRLNDRTTITVKLEVGVVTQTVEVSATAAGPDLSTTSTGANITEVIYENTPLRRNVVSPLYLSAGVADGGGTGISNPSIAGASGLENLYLIDGVNNTNTGFGGFGTYSRVFGSLGTGVTTSFIQEIQVKTGGMEAQYGQALGGVVTMVSKSGGTKLHGAVYGYYTPRAASKKLRQPNRFRTSDFLTEIHGVQEVDWGGEAGGPVPFSVFKDKLFWFGAINPVNTHTSRESPPGPSFLGPGSAFADLGQHDQIKRVINYAGKLSYHLNQNHLFEASIFGDPSIIQFGPNRSLVVSDFRSFSRLSFRGLNWQVRYNGTIANWVFTGSGGQNHNRFDEERLTDQYRTFDQTRFNRTTNTFDNSLPSIIRRGGVGFFEKTKGGADKFVNADVGHTFNGGRFGQHQINIGFQFENSGHEGVSRRTGPDWFLPADPKIPAQFVGDRVFGADVRLFSCQRKTGSPTCNGLVPAAQLIVDPTTGIGQGFYFRQTRGNFRGAEFNTTVLYHAGYAQDNWQMNKYVTVKAGLRWEQEKIGGNPTGFNNDCPVGFSDINGNFPTESRPTCSYTFNDSWGPRIGVVVDPWGNRKGKAFASFGRFFERIPQDLAQRSIVPESGFLKLVFFADKDLNPRLDTAHYIPSGNATCPAGAICNKSGATVEFGPVSSGTIPTVIAAGTRMQYQDEFVVGFEYELPKGILISARYQDRRIKRIVEDSAAFTADQANQGGNQQFVIQNVSAKTDNFNNVVTINATAANQAAICQAGTFDPVSGTCFTPSSGLFSGGDGIPDGFPDAKREYQAFEVSLERRMRNGWQFLSNFRISRLRGNFEGSFRNDNGQQDPNISSLFDFTSSGPNDPLAGQFAVGKLPTDRRYTINFYGSYLFNQGKLNGLNIGTGFRMASGTPITEFAAHPVYENAGELPIGGRGARGRTPVTGTVDVHGDYTVKLTERFRVKVLADVFNLANAQRLTRIDQNRDLNLGTPNPDFLHPLRFQDTLSSRFSVRFEW